MPDSAERTDREVERKQKPPMPEEEEEEDLLETVKVTKVVVDCLFLMVPSGALHRVRPMGEVDLAEVAEPIIPVVEPVAIPVAEPEFTATVMPAAVAAVPTTPERIKSTKPG